jgi:hypothetical protein
MLVLFQQQRLPLLSSIAMLTEMLDYAGANNKLAAAKWLREHGAAWPTVFTQRRWTGAVLEWAVAEGFTPPTN